MGSPDWGHAACCRVHWGSEPCGNGRGTGREGAGSTDPEGDDLFYYIDWGDGSVEDWFGQYESGEEVKVSHRWDEEGTYAVRVKAKDIYGVESDWKTMKVTAPRSKSIYSIFNNNILTNFLKQHPRILPLIRLLLKH